MPLNLKIQPALLQAALDLGLLSSFLSRTRTTIEVVTNLFSFESPMRALFLLRWALGIQPSKRRTYVPESPTER